MKQIFNERSNDGVYEALYLMPEDIDCLHIKTDSYYYIAEIVFKSGSKYTFKTINAEAVKALQDKVAGVRGMKNV